MGRQDSSYAMPPRSKISMLLKMKNMYEKVIKNQLPGAKHLGYLSQRSRPVGLGELRKGAFDPIFSINYTLTKMHDYIRRLSRRAWATTKKASELENPLFMYAWFQSLCLDGTRGVFLKEIAVTN